MLAYCYGYVLQWATVAAVVLLLYDYCLTLGREVRHIQTLRRTAGFLLSISHLGRPRLGGESELGKSLRIVYYCLSCSSAHRAKFYSTW